MSHPAFRKAETVVMICFALCCLLWRPQVQSFFAATAHICKPLPNCHSKCKNPAQAEDKQRAVHSIKDVAWHQCYVRASACVSFAYILVRCVQAALRSGAGCIAVFERLLCCVLLQSLRYASHLVWVQSGWLAICCFRLHTITASIAACFGVGFIQNIAGPLCRVLLQSV